MLSTNSYTEEHTGTDSDALIGHSNYKQGGAAVSGQARGLGVARERSQARPGPSHRRTTRRFGGSALVRPHVRCSGWSGWGYRGEMVTRERQTKWSKIIVFLGASLRVRIEFSSKSSSALYFVHIGSNILTTRTPRRNCDPRAV